MILRTIFEFVLVLAMVASEGCGGEGGGTDTFTLELSQGEVATAVQVEVAATPNQRSQGLMFRQEMGEDEGMLFLFPQSTQGGFWMRNTYIPLEIAYVSADGEVLEIRHGKPLDETPLIPATPYQYVLEVNEGWFARHGLAVGARVTLPAGLPEPQ